jgi:hypothetical protein
MAVSFALPSAVAAVLTAVGLTLAPPVGGLAGLAFAAWTIQRKRKRSRDGLLKPSPEAYLYRASKLSTPKTVTKEIYDSSRAFLGGSR